MIFAIFCYTKSKKMKAKNVIIIGAIGVGLYYLLKRKDRKLVQSNLVPKGSDVDEADVDLEDVMNGDEPTSLAPVDPLPRMISMKEKEALFKEANKSYTGVARPSQSLLQEIKEDKQRALRKIDYYGLMSSFLKWQNEQRKKPKDLPPPRKKPKYLPPPFIPRVNDFPFAKDVVLRNGLPILTTYAVNTTPNRRVANHQFHQKR